MFDGVGGGSLVVVDLAMGVAAAELRPTRLRETVWLLSNAGDGGRATALTSKLNVVARGKLENDQKRAKMGYPCSKSHNIFFLRPGSLYFGCRVAVMMNHIVISFAPPVGAAMMGKRRGSPA